MTEYASGFSDRAQMSFGPRWLTQRELMGLHEKLLERFGGPAGLKDETVLQIALNRPRNKWTYEGSDLPGLAAAYAYTIASQTPFVDGNKRAAFVSMMLFLRLNRVMFKPSQKAATLIILGVAAGEIDEDGLARWIRDSLLQA
jgi:death on curing protein